MVVSVIDLVRPRAVNRVILGKVCSRLGAAQQLVDVDHFHLGHVERIAERQATDASETVDPNLWFRILTRAGGEPIDQDAL